MKNFLLINLSPRREGTSAVLLQMCKKYMESKGHKVVVMDLYSHLKNPTDLFAEAKLADTLVFSGPCYVNTYPADTVFLLEELTVREELRHGQTLYGMIQGGMPYAHTHESGLHMLELFAEKNKLSYKGGFVMGLGAMLNGQKLEKLPNGKKVGRQLNVFFDHIEKDEQSPDSVYYKAELKLPGFVYKMMASRVNKTFDQNLRSRGIDR